MKKALLSPDLEHAVLYAVLRGVADLSVVEPEELSKTGRIIHRAIVSLREDGKLPPYELASVGLVAVEVLGQPKPLIAEYLRSLQVAVVGSEVKDILEKVRAKTILVGLINEASAMLGKGVIDVGLLNNVISSNAGASDIRPLAESLRDGFPEPPKGIAIRSLPTITEATGGLYGMWAISGEPGVGKTGLAWQIALDIAEHTPVIYEDFENGLGVLMDRTSKMVGGDIERARALTRNVYYRNSIRTLDADLAVVRPPAVIMVDSVQKLPGSVEHRRSSLDRWVHRMEGLKQRGYHIILVSEVARNQYNQDAYIGAFKESGEIEYSVDTGLQLIPMAGKDNFVEVHIVKNRHRPVKGFVTALARDKERQWKYKELGDAT